MSKLVYTSSFLIQIPPSIIKIIGEDLPLATLNIQLEIPIEPA